MSPSKPAIRRFVAYYRVSTDRQGKSGLGLDAQQAAVLSFINGDAELVNEFTEIESGKRADRPELAKALEACRRQKAELVIAKLDRLSRGYIGAGTETERQDELDRSLWPTLSGGRQAGQRAGAEGIDRCHRQVRQRCSHEHLSDGLIEKALIKRIGIACHDTPPTPARGGKLGQASRRG
jgi:Resolvase, N terminal domain